MFKTSLLPEKLNPAIPCPARTTNNFYLIFRTFTDSGGEDTSITVVFHAMLSDELKLDDRTKIVILGDEPFFSGWDHVGVHLVKKK